MHLFFKKNICYLISYILEFYFYSKETTQVNSITFDTIFSNNNDNNNNDRKLENFNHKTKLVPQ